VDDARNLLAAIDAAQPDVLLLDWELPHLVGPRMLVALRSRFPGLQVIVLSCQLENKQVALLSGADAFVSKIDPPDRLLALLRHKASELASQLTAEPSGVVSG
jgi:DNA-binding response OmpR family regulator